MAREITVTRINTQKSSVATTGPQGTQGPQGYQGVEGGFGASTLYYIFSTDNVDSDPGAGKLKFSNDDITLATSLYIDDQDEFATDVQTFLRTVDDSTSPLKGHFKISNRLNPADFAIFTISAITENTGYFTITCAHVTGASTSFSADEEVTITFARTGDIGPQGPQGNQGFQGPQGANGAIASLGVQAPILNNGTSSDPIIGVQAGTTGQQGVLQLTDSVASTSTTTAATPNSVKTAYDLANLAMPTAAAMGIKNMQASPIIIDNLERNFFTTSLTAVSGTVYLMMFTAPISGSVSQMTMVTKVAGATLTLARMGLFSVNEAANTVTLLARTASDTNLFIASDTAYTRSFNTTGGYPASYSLVAGTRYAMAVIITGTTMPSFAATVTSSGSNFANISQLTPRIGGTITGQTDFPTAATALSATAPASIHFARLLA